MPSRIYATCSQGRYIGLTVNIFVKHHRRGLPPTLLYKSSYLKRPKAEMRFNLGWTYIVDFARSYIIDQCVTIKASFQSLACSTVKFFLGYRR